ncbi:MAG: DUF4105 domain-containing protein [Bacteriovoracia bacterium]
MGVLFFCSFQVSAQNWRDKQWLRLLVYRETFTGYESEADDASFFVHPQGKFSPSKELKAFITSLHQDDPDPKKNSYCRFPARVRWLKKYTTVPASKVQCEDYEKFRKRISPKSISVVFSSYYLNNPASSFGHTFIRLGKNTNSDSTATELLDTGINYGAMTEGAGPVVFAIGGLTGWFSGNYNAVPYYYKVREYNDFETRDLWSYELDMSQEEIDLILDHIWELGHTKFDYFFLTENCSYHVLSILESARPTLELHRFLPRLYTIPSETLKALMAENLVSKITFRAAPSTQFYHQLNLLDSIERKAMEELVFQKKEVGELSPERKALIYDTALSLVDYKYAKDILKGDEKAQQIKRPLLVSRSKIPVRSKDLNFSEKFSKAPHLGHGQKRLGLGYVNFDSKNFLEAEWRFAFHDVLDNDIGYPPKTKLEVGKAIVRTDGIDVELREVSLVDVLMLGKWDVYNNSSSWKVRLGQWQTRDEDQFLSTQGVVGGYGYSYEYKWFTPYLLGHLETSYVSEKLHKFKLGYGADAGLLVDFNHRWKLNSVLEGRFHPWTESAFKNEVRYSNQSFGVGGLHQVFFEDGEQEVSLKFFKYF